MRVARRCSLVLLLVALAAPAVGQKVRVRTPGETDFTVYRTYRWAERVTELPDHPLRTGAPADVALREAVDEVLAKRGLELVEGDAADLIFDYEAAALDSMFVDPGRQRVTDDITVDLDGNRQNVRSYQQGTLVLQATDAASDRAVWIGSAQQKMRLAVDSENSRKTLAKLGRRIAQSFPVN